MYKDLEYGRRSAINVLSFKVKTPRTSYMNIFDFE